MGPFQQLVGSPFIEEIGDNKIAIVVKLEKPADRISKRQRMEIVYEEVPFGLEGGIDGSRTCESQFVPLTILSPYLFSNHYVFR